MIKVVHQGLGPIGQGTAKLVLEDPELEIVGAIDPEYAGKDLGDKDLLGTGHLGIQVSDDAKALFSQTRPDVVVLATSSALQEIIPQLSTAIAYGANIVSPAEQLFYAERVNKDSAEYIDEIAKEYNVRVLGGGVNPGCLMDAYPLYIFQKGDFTNLGSMTVYRWDDTTERRLPLLEKTGAGLTHEKFMELSEQGKLGHVGLEVSAAYLADNLGFRHYDIEFKRGPMIAPQAIKPTQGEEIANGQVAGLHETCKVIVKNHPIITLDLRMYVGAQNRNSVIINDIEADYGPIVNGDIATHRILHDAIKHVVKGPPGLNSVDYVPRPYSILKRA